MYYWRNKAETLTYNVHIIMLHNNWTNMNDNRMLTVDEYHTQVYCAESNNLDLL